MTEKSILVAISDAFIQSFDTRKPQQDQGFARFLGQNYPFLLLHMLGSDATYYKLLLANYPSDSQLQQIVREFPASLPALALMKYRSASSQTK